MAVLGVVGTIVLAVLASARPASAADSNGWTGLGGDMWWDNPLNWELGHIPQPGENVYLLLSSAFDRQILYRNGVNPSAVLGRVVISGSDVGWVILNSTTNNALNVTNFYLGGDSAANAGKGKIHQTQGDWSTTSSVYLGYAADSDGRYVMDGGTLTTGSTIYLGYDGTGIISQSNGTITNTYNLRMGYRAGSYGQYTMTGGILNSGNETSDTVYVGFSGEALFDHSGGLHSVSGNIVIGDQSAGDGTYHLNGTYAGYYPELNCENLIVGNSGTGEFAADSASSIVRGNLIIGQSASGSGSFLMADPKNVGSSMSIGGSVSVGPGGWGEMELRGGATNIAGGVTVTNGVLEIRGSAAATISGTLTLNGADAPLMRLEGGFLTSQGPIASAVVIGDTTFGRVEHYGGIHAVLGDVTMGKSAGSLSEYVMNESVGTSLLEARNLFVGKAGGGSFRQEGGGSVDLSGTLYIGQTGTASGGAYLCSGGTLDIAAAARIGIQGQGSMRIADDGDVTIGADATLGEWTGSSGALVLDGGSLTVGGGIIGGLGVSSFTYAGGTLSVGDHYIYASNISLRGGAGKAWTTSYDLDCDRLYVGTEEQAGTLIQTGGQLNVSVEVEVNYGGTWTLTNALNNLDTVTLRKGTINVNGGTMGIGGSLTVFDGTFSHTNGTVAAAWNLAIEADGGTYAFVDDLSLFALTTFACQDMNVKRGIFLQNGGAATVRGNLVLGGATSYGQVSLTETSVLRDTRFTVQGNADVGLAGPGQFLIESDPSVTIQGSLTVGGPAAGRFLMTGPATTTVWGNIVIDGSGQALLRISDGSLTSGQDTSKTVVVGKTSMGQVEHTAGTHLVKGDLVLGEMASSYGYYELGNSAGNAVLNARSLFVGKSGNGLFMQVDGDTNLSGSLYVGHDAASTDGTAVITDGTFDVAGAAFIGNQGVGTLAVAGGALTVGGSLNLGYDPASDGTLIISGGSLVIGGHLVRGFGASALDYQGGVLNVSGHYINVDDIRIGSSSGATWTTSDVIDCLDLRIGSGGVGGFVHNSVLNVEHDVIMGYVGTLYNHQGGTATVGNDLLMNNGGVETFAGGIAIARDVVLGTMADSSGSFRHAGGTVSIGRNLDIGTLSGTGSYTLEQGTLSSGDSTGDSVFVGKNSMSQGSFTQRGGTHNLAGGLYIGYDHDAVGQYVLTDDPAIAGSPALHGTTAGIGHGAEGHYTQSGGTAIFTGAVSVGRLAGSYGEMVLNSGSLEAGSLYIGRGGLGTFVQRGGFLAVNGELGMAYESTGIGSWVIQDDPGIAGTAGVETGTQVIGSMGRAAVLHYGGFNSCQSTLYLGYNTGSQGVYTITSGTVHADDGIVVGRAGHGELLIDGGQADTDGGLTIAAAGGSGTVRLSAGGTLMVGGAFAGYAGSTFIYDGGAFSQGSSSLPVGTFILGQASGTNALWALDTGDIQTDSLVVAAGGSAVLNVTGGQVVTSDLAVGSGGSGTVCLSGGLITVWDNVALAGTPGGSALLDLRGGSFNAVGDVTVGSGGLVKVLTAGDVQIGGSLALESGSTFRLAGGQVRLLDAAALDARGGAFAFDAGVLTLSGASDLDSTFLGAVLGADHELVSGQRLAVEGQATLQARLVLNGGTLATAGLLGGACLDFRRGRLEALWGGMVFGDDGPVGPSVAVAAGQTYAGAYNITIQPEASVTMSGGTLDAGMGYLDVYGLLGGGGTVRGALHLFDGGEIRVGAGETLRFDTTLFGMNFGDINLSDGTFEISGMLMNQSGAVVSGRGSIIAQGGFDNFGAMAFSAGATDIRGDVTNRDTGKILATGGAAVTFYDDVDNSGEIRTSAGCDTVFLGDLTGSGRFTGSGTVYIEGDLRPGHSPGSVHFDGDMILGWSAALVCELGGAAPGEFDRILVDDTLTLDGQLNVVLLNGYMPSAGDSFDIADWRCLDGEFYAVNLPALSGPLAWDTTLLYETGQIQVTPEPASLALLLLGAAAICRRRCPSGAKPNPRRPQGA